MEKDITQIELKREPKWFGKYNKNRLYSKTSSNNKEKYCIILKGSIYQEDIAIINIDAANNIAP